MNIIAMKPENKINAMPRHELCLSKYTSYDVCREKKEDGL
jgi:hypothetical protein